MTSEQYLAAWGLIAGFAQAPLARPYGLSRGMPAILPQARNAIYIATDQAGGVRYVGSSRRGVHARLGDHAREVRRARGWDRVWVIALRDDLPRAVVEMCEGRVGRSCARWTT